MTPHHLDHVALQPIELAAEVSGPVLPPLRGLVIGTIAVGLGGAGLAVSGSGVAAGDLALLVFLFVGALIGGRASARLAPRPDATGGRGTWMTVVINADGPAGTEVAVTKPPASPHSDPERRSLRRLARGRRRPRREVALSTAD